MTPTPSPPATSFEAIMQERQGIPFPQSGSSPPPSPRRRAVAPLTSSRNAGQSYCSDAAAVATPGLPSAGTARSAGVDAANANVAAAPSAWRHHQHTSSQSSLSSTSSSSSHHTRATSSDVGHFVTPGTPASADVPKRIPHRHSSTNSVDGNTKRRARDSIVAPALASSSGSGGGGGSGSGNSNGAGVSSLPSFRNLLNTLSHDPGASRASGSSSVNSTSASSPMRRSPSMPDLTLQPEAGHQGAGQATRSDLSSTDHDAEMFDGTRSSSSSSSATALAEQSRPHPLPPPPPPPPPPLAQPRSHLRSLTQFDPRQRSWSNVLSSPLGTVTMAERSFSPSRRPPLSPSAFAHNIGLQPMPQHYPSHAPMTPSTMAMEHRSSRPNTASLDGVRMHEMHSSSSSSALGLVDDEASSIGKRSPPETQAFLPPSSRRRHTVGALDEPTELHRGQSQQQPPPSAPLSPRRHAQQLPRAYQTTPPHLLSSRTEMEVAPLPESPTTPTAMPRQQQQSQQQQHFQRSRAVPPGSGQWSYQTQQMQGAQQTQPQQAATYTAPRFYMNATLPSAGSMPSLPSSSMQASGGERSRPDSLEGPRSSGMERRFTFSTASQHSTGSDVATTAYATSPSSSIWHSRSSTLDSIEAPSSSSASSSDHKRLPMPPPRSSSLGTDGGTQTRAYNEGLGGNHEVAYPSVQQQQHHQQAQPTPRQSPYAHGAQQYRHQPGGDFQSTSEMHALANSRPRAKTTAFTDRPIARLPSHAHHFHPQQQQQHLHQHHHDQHRQQQQQQQQMQMQVRQEQQHISHQQQMQQRQIFNHHHQRQGFSTHHPHAHLQQQQMGESHNLPQRVSSMSLGATPPASQQQSWNRPQQVVALVGVGQYKYACPHCDKRFSRPSSLKIHVHSHTGEKPYKCSRPDCGRGFSVQSNLRRHERNHEEKEAIASATAAATRSADPMMSMPPHGRDLGMHRHPAAQYHVHPAPSQEYASYRGAPPPLPPVHHPYSRQGLQGSHSSQGEPRSAYASMAVDGKGNSTAAQNFPFSRSMPALYSSRTTHNGRQDSISSNPNDAMDRSEINSVGRSDEWEDEEEEEEDEIGMESDDPPNEGRTSEDKNAVAVMDSETGKSAAAGLSAILNPIGRSGSDDSGHTPTGRSGGVTHTNTPSSSSASTHTN